ncbi:MAG: efflux RND transporter periplasmic adaptor subunit [Planctomycetaceae bacterium]|nr:efflux RND transporter periplasmic adaptor subunit [Planctomycetaceae bacterium]
MSQKLYLSQRVWDGFQFFLCLGIVVLLLVYLTIWHGHDGHPHEAAEPSRQESDVSVTGPKSISICPDSPIYRKLRITAVNRSETTEPIVTATGVNVASLQTNGNGVDGTQNLAGTPGTVELSDFWQFHSTELLTTFADWQKADAEIAFAEQQLQSAVKLAGTTVEAQKAVVERLEKLVQVGTDTPKDLAEAKATLIQTEIEGQKAVYETQAALRLAQREKAALARQLTLEGLQPELLVSITRDIDIVMAEVPESMIRQVKVGQSCVALFFSCPETKFYGKVLSIVPVLSKELRSLRVLFAIEDAADSLRPGMFAEIGLGIDPRSVLHVPPESIVHIGGSDYVLVRKSDSDWIVTKVQIGELHEAGAEVHSGLEDGAQIAGKGVILLKPTIAESLRLK